MFASSPTCPPNLRFLMTTTRAATVANRTVSRWTVGRSVYRVLMSSLSLTMLVSACPLVLSLSMS